MLVVDYGVQSVMTRTTVLSSWSCLHLNGQLQKSSASTFCITLSLVYTDHNPLKYLDNAEPCATEQQWVAQLAEFNFEIRYKPGRTNVNADVLSRLPNHHEPELWTQRKIFFTIQPQEVRACLWPQEESTKKECFQLQSSRLEGYSVKMLRVTMS